MELLEPRLALASSSPLVGDALFAYYDSQAYGTVEPAFERAAPTYDPTGAFQEADTRRFADEVAYAPPIEWSGTGVTPSVNRQVKILASGWDHDGVTPIAVVRIEGERIEIYRGEELSRVGSISNTQLGQAAGENRQL